MNDPSHSNQKADHCFKLSFIIPALNEAKLLERLLLSLDQLRNTSNIIKHEVILVDAASTDGTRELALSHGCRIVDAKPGCVSASRNLGARSASGDMIAFVDADCELPTDWLESADQQILDPTVVAIGSSMALRDNNVSWVEKTWYALAHQQSTNDPCSDVDWLATFNLLVKKAAFEQAGGFDETLVTCEDVEFGYRLSAIGQMRRLNHCLVIHHGESQSIPEFYRREAWRARGAITIVLKHWKNLREVISFLMPIYIVLGFCASIILTIGVAIIQPQLLWLPLTLAVLTGPLPLTLLIVKKNIRITKYFSAMTLLSVYFYARFIGLIRPFQRVER